MTELTNDEEISLYHVVEGVLEKARALKFGLADVVTDAVVEWVNDRDPDSLWNAPIGVMKVARDEAVDIVDRHTRLGGTGKPRSAEAAVDALIAWGWNPPEPPREPQSQDIRPVEFPRRERFDIHGNPAFSIHDDEDYTDEEPTNTQEADRG